MNAPGYEPCTHCGQVVYAYKDFRDILGRCVCGACVAKRLQVAADVLKAWARYRFPVRKTRPKKARLSHN